VLAAHGITESAASKTAIGASGFWPRSGSSSIAGLPATTGNFFSPSTEFGYSYNGVARVDHQISDKHHLSLHAIIGQGNQTAPLGGSPALGTASSNLAYYFEVAPLHDGNYGAVLNSTLSSRWTNQFLFGASYFNQLFHDNNNGFDTKAMGIFLSPDATAHGQPIHGAPNIIIAPPSKGGSGGFEQIGLTPPEGRSDLTLHFTDILSTASESTSSVTERSIATGNSMSSTTAAGRESLSSTVPRVPGLPIRLLRLRVR